MRTIPLSPRQRGLYFLHRVAPHSPVYHVPVVLHITGDLDRDRLQAAVDRLHQRHESLRSTFSDAGQHLHDNPEPVKVVWLPEATVREVAAEPFDLERGPLWRVNVIGTGPYLLVFTFHHVIVDEPSMAVLGKEFAIAYADPAGLALPGPPLPAPSTGLSGLDYWQRRLADVADLPFADGGTGFNGARVPLRIDADTLEKVCREHRVTPFMAIYAAMAVLLSRWAGAPKVGVGSAIPGPASEAVGYFQNTVVLATEITAGATFAEVLKRARSTVAEALQYRDTAFDTVVEAVRPARAGLRNPLFQAALVYTRGQLEEGWDLPGLEVRPHPYDWPTAHFGLAVAVTQQPGSLIGGLNYDTAVFTAPAAQQLASAFETLLLAVLSDPGQPVAEIRLDLPVLAAQAIEAAQAVAPAPQPLVQRLTALFSEVLELEPVEPDDDFFELGGHSLLALRLVETLGRELDRPVSVGDFMLNPTPAGFAAALAETETSAPQGLVRLSSGEDTTAIVLVHPVGGTLFCYTELLAALGPEANVVGFERAAGTPDRSLEAIADRYAAALATVGAQRYVVVGWSLGGVIAHEVAARLPSARLVLLDSFATSVAYQREQLADRAATLLDAASRLSRKGMSIVDDLAEVLKPLGVDVQALRQTPAAQVATLLRDWAEMLTLASRHEPKPASVRTLLYTGSENAPGVSEAMAATWAGLCGGLWHESVPGDHFGLLRRPAVQHIADGLGEQCRA